MNKKNKILEVIKQHSGVEESLDRDIFLTLGEPDFDEFADDILIALNLKND